MLLPRREILHLNRNFRRIRNIFRACNARPYIHRRGFPGECRGDHRSPGRKYFVLIRLPAKSQPFHGQPGTAVPTARIAGFCIKPHLRVGNGLCAVPAGNVSFLYGFRRICNHYAAGASPALRCARTILRMRRKGDGIIRFPARILVQRRRWA